MGLYDYVRCEVPLPDGYTGELQTKHFPDPYMVTHVITRGGRLLQAVVVRVESVPQAERPYPNAPDDDVSSVCGSIRTVVEMRDASFHGMFEFYGVGEHNYVATFSDGQLVEIRCDDAE